MAGTSDSETLALASDPLLSSAFNGGDTTEEMLLEAELRRLETFLAVLGFHHPNSPAFCLRLAASASTFLLLVCAAPFASMALSRCLRSGCREPEIEQFELTVLVSQGLLVAVSLTCVSRNLFKYGVRRFLFMDHNHGQVVRLQEEYARQIKVVGPDL